MNENLNLVEILKDCPRGTKLYSTVFGDVEFDRVVKSSTEYLIEIKLESFSVHKYLTAEGKLFAKYDGECTLFPSREQRDWYKFKPKKEEFATPYKFNDGDIIATNLGSQVFILKKEEIFRIGYCYIGYDFERNMLFPAGTWYFSRLATEEEKQKLFDTIKLNGYKWNVETKTLEKLVKPKFKVGDKIVFAPMKYIVDSRAKSTISEITDDKYIFIDGSCTFISNQDNWKLDQERFDPKTLKPYDKVLVRDSYLCSWRCTFYSHIKEDGNPFKYITDNSAYEFCIPYNEETKHLVGTTENAPEYYRYWDD